MKQAQQLQPVRNRERNEIVENKPIPEESKPSASRYPKRGGSRKCYKEQQVPDEDHFLCKFLSFILFFTKDFTYSPISALGLPWFDIEHTVNSLRLKYGLKPFTFAF